MNKILIADSDRELTKDLQQFMTAEGFDVTCVHDGEEALKKALNQSFDAIILEIILPNLNGFEVLRSVRKHLETPILLLTGRDDDIDKILAFEIGADDYLSKPCSPAELIARLRTLLRRTQKSPAIKSIIEYENIKVDCSKRIVTLENEEIELTNAEFNILEMVIKSPGQAFSKEELTEYALGRQFTAYDRSIDVHISNLRNKLGHNSTGEEWIKTVRGFGYLFNANSA